MVAAGLNVTAPVTVPVNGWLSVTVVVVAVELTEVTNAPGGICAPVSVANMPTAISSVAENSNVFAPAAPPEVGVSVVAPPGSSARICSTAASSPSNGGALPSEGRVKLVPPGVAGGGTVR